MTRCNGVTVPVEVYRTLTIEFLRGDGRKSRSVHVTYARYLFLEDLPLRHLYIPCGLDAQRTMFRTSLLWLYGPMSGKLACTAVVETSTSKKTQC
jgi:hypothetical protein